MDTGKGIDIRCGRCQRVIGPTEKRHRGDKEFDEWLCCSCWDELGILSRHNSEIIRSISEEEGLSDYQRYLQGIKSL
jgi:hypothetical protein